MYETPKIHIIHTMTCIYICTCYGIHSYQLGSFCPYGASCGFFYLKIEPATAYG